jgi:hypothetical protein
MLRSSLLEILRTFSKQELIKFEDFVRSPYFNKKENVIRLLLELKKSAPLFSGDYLTKEEVWSAIFPGKEYNYGIMKNLIHDLTGLSEKFILLEHYAEDSYRCDYDLIEAGNSRNIQRFTSGKIDQFEKRVRSEIDPNRYSMIDDYLYVTSNYYYAKSSFIKEYDLKKEREESLRLASDHLLYYFLVNSFKLIHNTIAHEVQGHRPVSNSLLEKLFLNLEEHSILEDLLLNENKGQDKLSKIVICFYLMYKALISDGDKAGYERFKSYLRENIDLLSAFELQNLNNCRITCAINLKTPDTSGAKESIEWYKLLMEKNLFLQRNGLITTPVMSNVINQSIKLNETAFAEEFLNRYAFKLPADSRENTYNYCMAIIHFSRKEFGKSLECLSKISDEKLIRKYFLKKLYLKIYYELNDFESFKYAFDTFTHFKKRNKLTNEARAMAFNNFGNNIRILFKLRNSLDKYESEKLRKSVLTNLNKDQSWFIEKLNEIEG